MLTDEQVSVTDKLATGSVHWEGACIVTTTFSTNGFQGGDGGHGGFVELTLDNEASMALEVVVDDREATVNDRLTLRFSGDDEMAAAAALFSFLGEELTRALEKLARRSKQKS